jgi:DNA-binding response OmpR family regulator
MSGRGDIDILRAAFHRWATDYLIKPFRLKELEVRVHHWFQNYCFPILKDTKNLSPDRLFYNTERNEFSIDGSIMILSRLQKYLFFIFFSNPGRLLSPQFLREKVWGDYEDSPERSLRVSILRLRRTLDVYKLSGSIMTIRGEWYIFQL